MSDEESPDLTKSWVFIDPEKNSPEKTTSGVEEVETETHEPHGDSDTDSISVISESGWSYKTDEDDFVPATSLESDGSSPETIDDKTQGSEIKPLEGEVKSPEPEITELNPNETQLLDTTKTNLQNDKAPIEKISYFVTSAACAVILLGFSVAVQQYFFESSDVNSFNADFEQNGFSPVMHQHVQTVKAREIQVGGAKKIYLKRRGQSKFEEPQSKISKLENDNNLSDKIVRPNAEIKNNDLRVEDVKSNFKPNKNKSPAVKSNKENHDDIDKRVENDKYKKKNSRNSDDRINNNDKIKNRHKSINEDNNRPQDETYTKKLKQLKAKEAYLKQKEKFLLEKEHDLKKKEIKLNKGNHNYETKVYYQNEKKHKRETSEEDSGDTEKKNKFNKQKKYPHENYNPKNNKKYKHKEEKKQNNVQKQPRFVDNEPHKKRNISGQWYINLHKARNNIRQKEHASDWVFDRAQLRSMKRNKAHWYFQWMVDRARLRVK